MASRLFWIFLTGVAIVAGLAVQQRDLLFGWDSGAATDRGIEARIDRSIDRSFDRIQVMGSDGKSIDVAPETKRALGDAVGRLVSAETQLALVKLRHSDDAEIRQAISSRDAERAEVDRLKDQIDREKQLSDGDRDVVRDQIQQRIRDDIRESIRSAVRN
ncbi:MAG TPA: hypothetical protein VNS53_02850 [Sphingomicrobium sp.]|nr:hypothetical protein [Sphingomicrobium sp.]